MYKALLIDDSDNARKGAEKFRAHGVDFKTVAGVDECLREIFGISDIKSPRPFTEVSHDFDIVLIDYELPNEMDLYPNMGLAIYPLFVHSYKSTTPGQCIVCSYSAMLQKAYAKYSALFRLGEQIRLGKDVSYHQGGFGGFELSPLIQARADNLLRKSGTGAIIEVWEKWMSGDLDGRLGVLSDLLKFEVTLRSLRPDYGNDVFFRVGSAPRIDTQTEEFGKWLHALVTESNYAKEAHAVYSYDGVPNVNRWAHMVNSEEVENDPRKFLKDGRLQLDKPRTLHQGHVEALMATTFHTNVEKCSQVHKAFRLSLDDSNNCRPDHSTHKYAKGYFLADVTPTAVTITRPRDGCDGYVYVPQKVLKSFLEDLTTQLPAKEIRVDVCEDGRFAIFWCKSDKTLNEMDASAIATNAKWKCKKDIHCWGELAVFTNDGAFAVLGNKLQTMPTRLKDYPVENNSVCLMFPKENN